MPMIFKAVYSCNSWICLVSLSLISGCARYVTPGPAANLNIIRGEAELDNAAEDSISIKLQRKPTARFPVNIAVLHVQGAQYRSHSTRAAHGEGLYTVVTARDVETEEDFKRLMSLPRVRGIAAVNRLLVPRELNTDRDLRHIAAQLQAEMVLLYTFDTTFEFGDSPVAPLGVFTLGLFPTEEARVSSTASALVLDTQTGYIYATVEGSAHHRQVANAWTTEEAADESRRHAEREAFDKLLNELEQTWSLVVARYEMPSPQQN